MDGLADDLAWVCAQLELVRPLVVGHSLGVIVASALAANHPGVVGAIVAVDSVLLVGDARKAAMTTLLERLRSDDHLRVVREYVNGFFDPADDPERRRWILKEIGRVPSQVGSSIWEDGRWSSMMSQHFRPAGRRFFTSTPAPHVNLNRLRRMAPHLTLGRTVGSGHANQLEALDQVNAMIARFLETV